MTQYNLDIDTHAELRELLEDTIEFFCDENMVSGELAWLVAETISTAKYYQLKGAVA